MIRKAIVTLEFSTIFVRLHDKPTTWGDMLPYEDGFALVQVAPHIYEAKLAKDLDFRPSHQRALKIKMLSIGAKEVFLWRHKEGESPYKLVIRADGITRVSA